MKQINNIKSIVNIFENSWFLLYKFNIQNYQTINNMKYSLTMMPSQNELEYLYKEFLMCLFGDLISGITKKKINDINVKELYSQFNKDDEIIPLIENKKEQYCVILDKNGLISVCQFKANKIINKLYDDFSFKNGDCIMPYNENIIIILKEMALLIIDFINNKKYNLDLYNYLFTLVKSDDRNYFNLEDNEYNRRFYFRHILAKNPNAKNDLIKIDPNNILLIYCKKVCLITFDDFLSKITNFIILENHNDIVKASQIFYKSNNVVKKGIIIISEKFDENEDYFPERKLFLRPKYRYLNNKYLLKMSIYDNDMKIIQQFYFTIPIKNKYDGINITSISYNFTNDMILIIGEQRIYQISSITKELVTIYDVSQYINDTIIKSSIFFNYDEKTKKFEQIILLINKSKDEIHQFNWDNKMILFKKKCKCKNIIDFSPLYTPDQINELTDIQNG